ncbi:allergen Tha p 1-like [Ostrinia nubilalis]|uniref:Chemosensory protein 4 n=1 Tax=Ostrinia furnacalis TaxID=93504 RepID=A0A1B4ZBM6_OSTFU|nr:allergen Tha p 1-like [Ostrinia furnacalis]XP_028174916.1 allergen Tha p 1-like [Ostrinia furnacalis]BAV56808.1 chemosensory protein 4 [Ostrinia furnacalis]
MKTFVLLALSLVVAVAYARPGAQYTDKWDHINVDEILESQRLLRGYVDCLLDKGRCTPDGKALKETLPDALEHDCSKCTEKQKASSDKVIRHLINKQPDYWKELSAKYDPNNIYQDKYKDKIEEVKSKN